MKSRRAECGFSLLEVMIAMAIIAFSIFAILSMVMGTMASQEALRELETAKEAAAQKIEQIKSSPFATALAAYPANTPVQFPVAGLSDMTFPDKIARGTVTTQVDAAQSIMDVFVSVTWKGRKEYTTYNMRSLYAK